ncbi:hypothetical protein CARUB_v10027780mg [Capsella rubella]|uniref:Uncharacterized protein n=1 Tax=Capsella rubella TaxID=81985 RepID=R0EV20_9BRAS|nr:uncharacterized protein LOC17876427 [Capsella rubella]EOA12666.1 hypothetical protein CARUB_v10027780mg [Capsella rubella]
MTDVNNLREYKKTFRSYDHYVNGKISWKAFGYSGLRKRSTRITKSEIDKIFVELGTRGGDRVFRAYMFSGNHPIRPSILVTHKPKDVVNVKLLQKEVVVNVPNEKKIHENQPQIPKQPLENIKINEDSVVIEYADDKEFELC